jgi:hypothetical protein
VASEYIGRLGLEANLVGFPPMRGDRT